MNHRILLIEDSPESCQVVLDTLGKDNCDVATVSDCDEMLEKIEQWPRQFDAVIIEESMQGGKGMSLLHAVRNRTRRLPIVMVTRDGTWEGCARALAEGALNYLQFPLNPNELRRTIHRALAAHA